MRIHRAESDDAIEEAAAAWLARLHSDDCSEADRDRFRSWVAADDRHAATFEELTALWDSVGRAPRVATGRNERNGISRRTVVSGILASSVGVAGMVGWSAAYAGVHQTAVGEQKRILLDDGTRVLLDTDTKIRFRALDDASEVHLYYGQASFVARRPTDRLLRVTAGTSELLAADATFDVDFVDAQTACVTVANGAVRFRDGGTRRIAAIVRRGEIASANMAQPRLLSHEDLSKAMSWQTGQLIFSDDHLQQVVQEMNRYSKEKITILDRTSASIKISGTFHSGDNAGFVRSLAIMLPVNVIKTSEGYGIKSRDSA